MNRRYYAGAFLFALGGFTLCAQTSPEPSPPPRAVTSPTAITATFWNIQWFPGRRPNASRAEVERQIRAVNNDVVHLTPDILGLEEVRNFEQASLAVAPLPGFKVDVCSNFPPREGQKEGQQVAIASRLQPMSAWAEAWKPGAALTPPRGFAFAAYQLSPKQVLLVYAIHLKSNRGEIHEDMRIREESSHQLLAHIKAMKDAYGKAGTLSCIVGGDFNTAPDDSRFHGERTCPDILTDGFRWAWEGLPASSRITMPPDARYPAASFDQIFYCGAILAKAWVADTSPQSSDHRAVNAIFNFEE